MRDLTSERKQRRRRIIKRQGGGETGETELFVDEQEILEEIFRKGCRGYDLYHGGRIKVSWDVYKEYYKYDEISLTD